MFPVLLFTAKGLVYTAGELHICWWMTISPTRVQYGFCYTG